jgi:hypothetical protein
MTIYTRAAAILLTTFSTLCLTAQPSGPSGETASASAHPSNGVVQLTVTAAVALEHRRPSDPPEVYAPWRGLLDFKITNVSSGLAHLVETSTDMEYIFEVMDASGEPVPPTEEGKQVAAALANTSTRRFSEPLAVLDLSPAEEFTAHIDLSVLYQIQPGRAYKIRVKRSKGLPQKDQYGRPTERSEVSVVVDIPEMGILR